MLFLLPLLPVWWWPLGLPFAGLAAFGGLGSGGLGAPLLMGIPLSVSSLLAYAVVFVGMGLLARRALNA